MKSKIKKAIACGLLGLLFAGMFAIGSAISCGTITRLQGLAIIIVCAVPTFIYTFKAEEEK